MIRYGTLMTGMLIGIGAGMVAGALLGPAIAPKLKKAVRAGKNLMSRKMCEFEDQF